MFQIDASGKPFVLLDSSYDEIHTLSVDAGGNIYVAAVRGRPTPAQARPPAPGAGGRACAADRLGLHRSRDHDCRRLVCRGRSAGAEGDPA